MEAAAQPWPALGVLLLRDGLVTKEELESVLDEQVDNRQQRISSRRLGEILVERGMVTETQVAQLVAEQYELTFVDLHVADIDLATARLLDESLAHRLSAVAVGTRSDGSYVVAIADPSSVLFSEELRRALGSSQTSFVVVGQAAIDAALDHVYHQSPAPALPAEANAGAEEEMGVVLELPTPSPDPFAHPDLHRWPPLGALLVREGLVNEADLEAALAQQRLSSSRRLGEILVDRGSVTTADVARLVAEQYELPFVDLGTIEIDPEVAVLLPEKVARRRSALPFERLPDGSLRVAIADPTNVFQSDELRGALGATLTFSVAAPEQIEGAIDTIHRPSTSPTEHAHEDEPVTEPPGPEWAADDHREDAAAWLPVDDATEPDLDDSASRIELEPSVAETSGWFVADGDLDLEDLPAFEPLKDEPPVETTLASDDQGDEPGESPHEVGEQAIEAAQPDETHDEAEHLEVEHDEADVPDAAQPDETQFEADHPEAEHLVADLLDAAQADEAQVAAEHDHVEHHVVDVPDTAQLDEELMAEVEETLAVAVSVSEQRFPAESEPKEPLLQEVHETILRALALGATTIQLTPRPDGLAVRARIGRSMQDVATFPSLSMGSLTAHVAEQAGVDASTRSPRRGLLAVEQDERTVTLEVSTLPTKLGLQLSLRVPEATGSRERLTDLGMPADAESVLREALRTPSGVVVVCGPALSGRTTTLYAALQELASPERALATVEYPVDRLVGGVDQVDVDPTSGVTFPGALRALFRAGADTILVGELGDAETAQVAFRGARGERLVLASLEALTATAALEKLTGELAVDPQLVASTLSCVVAQHLVRRTCVDCRESYYASAEEIAELGRPDEESGRRLLARGRGCSTCAGTGYAGWVGAFEVLPPNDDVRTLVAESAATSVVREAAVAAGMSTVHDRAVGFCLDGVTTVSEVRLVPRD